jgi:2-polyprenyl-6-methoxyphenol hydroxylase-like FAD-dependent oxidoreductase
MVDVDKILIVGGGIAGLTLAAALQARGFEIDLIERNPTWRTLGAGMANQPNAMRALRALELDRAVADRGLVLHRWGFCDQQGELLYEIDLQDFWNGVGPFVGIERAKLQQALLLGAVSVPYRLGTSVVGLWQDHDGVSVCFSDRSSGRYDLVVGADGIASSIRELAFGPNPPAGAGHIAWRSVVPMRPAKLSDLPSSLEIVASSVSVLWAATALTDLVMSPSRTSTMMCAAGWRACGVALMGLPSPFRSFSRP